MSFPSYNFKLIHNSAIADTEEIYPIPRSQNHSGWFFLHEAPSYKIQM